MKNWVQTYHKSNANFKKLKVYILYLCDVEYPSFFMLTSIVEHDWVLTWYSKNVNNASLTFSKWIPFRNNSYDAWLHDVEKNIEGFNNHRVSRLWMPKRLPYVFIYEHEKVMFLFHFKNYYYDAWFQNVEKNIKGFNNNMVSRLWMLNCLRYYNMCSPITTTHFAFCNLPLQLHIN